MSHYNKCILFVDYNIICSHQVSREENPPLQRCILTKYYCNNSCRYFCLLFSDIIFLVVIDLNCYSRSSKLSQEESCL